MKREKRSVPLYQRFGAGEAPRLNVAGAEFAPAPGSDPTKETATWLLPVGAAGGVEPQAGTDYLRDTAGRWWLVAEVGQVKDGARPLKCTRWRAEA